jgi:hypothetical protein
MSEPIIKSRIMPFESINQPHQAVLVEPYSFRIDDQKIGSAEKVSKINDLIDISQNDVTEDLEEEKVVTTEDFLEAID